jgi:hypothetical protein
MAPASAASEPESCAALIPASATSPDGAISFAASLDGSGWRPGSVPAEPSSRLPPLSLLPPDPARPLAGGLCSEFAQPPATQTTKEQLRSASRMWFTKPSTSSPVRQPSAAAQVPALSRYLSYSIERCDFVIRGRAFLLVGRQWGTSTHCARDPHASGQTLDPRYGRFTLLVFGNAQLRPRRDAPSRAILSPP